ncbi:MAG TPA: tetratricopeptide repeat protein [Terriglobales bacterium]|nr:tetratricopeptide repeat protein [Terriglobales bacterium]
MFSLLGLMYPWGILLQVTAIVHFIRRRPDTYWLWVILFLGPIGALVYIVAEVLPDAQLLGGTFRGFSRRRRIGELQAIVMDNPSAGNYEELGQLYLDEGKFARAKECFDRSISSRTDSPDPFYRRGICSMELGDFAGAVPDLERAVGKDPKYDFSRAPALLAHAYARTGQNDKADALFREVMRTSTLTESQVHYAEFLKSQGRSSEARELLERVLNKKRTMPGFQKRRERPWFRRAAALLKDLR